MTTANPVGEHPAPRIIGGIVATLVAVPFVWTVFVALVGRFSTSGDPHGYGLIFGTFVALITGLLLSVSIPWIFPRAKRPRVFTWCLAGYVVVAATLIALLLTA